MHTATGMRATIMLTMISVIMTTITMIMVLSTPTALMIMVMRTTTITTTTTSTAVTIMLMITGTRPGKKSAQAGGDTAGSNVGPGAAPGIVDEQAALYRLMTWLSPSFPVGAFAHSSGLEWAVEAGDIVSSATLQDWLAVMLTDGAGFCDGVFLAHAHRALVAGDAAGLADVAETRRGLRSVAGTAAGNHDAGAGLHRDRAIGLGLCRPRASGHATGTAPGLSRRCGDRECGAWPWAASDACTPSCMRSRRTGSPRPRDWFHWDRPTASGRWRRSSRLLSRPVDVRWRRRLTISAARHSGPISLACAMRHSTPGCSGHEHHRHPRGWSAGGDRRASCCVGLWGALAAP